MTRRVLAAMAAATWLAGCVSILGVDAEDHRDVAEILCACSDARRDTCADAVGAVLDDRSELQERVLACAAEHDDCGELDACLETADVCSGPNGDCNPAEVPGRVNLRCCGDLDCTDAGKCRARSCVDPGLGCADGRRCCSGAACAEGTCPSCASIGDPCTDAFPCCAGGQAQLRCDDGECVECAELEAGCSDTRPCCDGGTCTEVGGTSFCLP